MKSIVLFAAASLLSASALAAVPVLSNGSFETNNVAAGSYAYSDTVTATDWTFTDYAGVAANGSVFGSAATSGNYYALLQSYGSAATASLSQSFTVTDAGTYSFNFDLSARASHDSGEVVTVSVDNVVIGTYNSTTSWTAQSASTTLAAGTYTLTLTGSNATPGVDSTAYVDNVRIAAASAVSAVPEASTYAMLLAGLGMVGFMVRRRNAS